MPSPVKLLQRIVGDSSFKAFLLLALICWTAHFLYFRELGLYEDDYAFIADAMARDVSYLFEKLQYFVVLPQGRPIGFYCAALFGFIGDHLGGLSATYLIGFGIVTLNCYLFYCILKRSGIEILALTGSIAFALFPADTTKPLLTHAFILQVSLSFLLIATLCYLSGRKRLSYLVILGSLFSYESAFIVFAGIPLLEEELNRRWVKSFLRHLAIFLSLMVIALIVRKITGESRIADLLNYPTFTAERIFNAIILGSKTSLSLFFKAPFQALFSGDRSTLLAMIGCFIGLTPLLLATKSYLSNQQISLKSRFPTFLRGRDEFKVSTTYLKICKLLGVGMILLCLSYSLAVTFSHYPPTVEAGRLTSVHLAATFGGSLVFACLVSILILWATKKHKKLFILLLVSLYFSCLFGYSFMIQSDYRQSWQNQRQFWTEVIENCPDLDQKTIVLVVDKNLPETKFILTHSWADPLVIKQIYQGYNRTQSLVLSEALWAQPPTLFFVPPDWQNRVVFQEKVWSIPLETWQGYTANVSPESIILLIYKNGHLTRVKQPIAVQGKLYSLKQDHASPLLSQPGVLYKYLIDYETP